MRMHITTEAVNLKQYNEAIKDYNQAIELNPKHAETYNNRGNAKASQTIQRSHKRLQPSN